MVIMSRLTVLMKYFAFVIEWGLTTTTTEKIRQGYYNDKR